MRPLGETVLAWRLARGLTQEALALAAGVGRPNLSAIERGDRDVTLGTLRRLALALDVSPGVLADGVGPEAQAAPLSRAELVQLARDATAPRPPAGGTAGRLARVIAQQRRAAGETGARAAGARGAERDWLWLRMHHGPAELRSLLERCADELDRRRP